MESLAEFGYLGLFISSFLGATIIPLSSEIVLSILILNGFDLGLSLVLATTGNWLGGLSSYYLGSLGKWNIIENGGWHFTYLMKPKEIVKKIESMAHTD